MNIFKKIKRAKRLKELKLQRIINHNNFYEKKLNQIIDNGQVKTHDVNNDTINIEFLHNENDYFLEIKQTQHEHLKEYPGDNDYIYFTYNITLNKQFVYVSKKYKEKRWIDLYDIEFYNEQKKNNIGEILNKI